MILYAITDFFQAMTPWFWPQVVAVTGILYSKSLSKGLENTKEKKGQKFQTKFTFLVTVSIEY